MLKRISHLSKRQRKITLVIDDSSLDKFGHSIFGVSWYKRRKEEIPRKALQVVYLGILYDDWFVPLDFRIYVSQEICKRIPMRFETKLVMASKMIRKLRLPKEFKTELIFDSWYLNEQITKITEKRGWKWYSRSRRNRKIKWRTTQKNEKKEIQLAHYSKEISWQNLTYKTKRKRRAVVGHQRIGSLKKIGQIKLVCTSLEMRGEKQIAFFCTNNLQIPMIEVIKKYERRWKIEVYFRESRAHLALEHWFFRDIASVVHHLCLSIVAMIACFCVLTERKKTNENLGTLGEFIRNVQKENQRSVFQFLIKQSYLENISLQNENEFNALCDFLDL